LELEVSDEEVRQTAVKIVGRDIIRKGRTKEEHTDTKLNAVFKMIKLSLRYAMK
jgi:hypothetical protein